VEVWALRYGGVRWANCPDYTIYGGISPTINDQPVMGEWESTVLYRNTIKKNIYETHTVMI
jgi:hypothetical protein